MKIVKHIILNTFNFKGLTTRKEYWLYLLFYYVSLMILAFILGAISGNYIRANNITPNGSMFVNVYFYYSILLIPMISATVRRLRDAGVSPWLIFVPILNIILCLKPSKKFEA